MRAAAPPRPARTPAPRRSGRLAPALLLCALAALVTGVSGGLLRLGLTPPTALRPELWLGHAAAAHAALMVCGFMGTVIGMERAVALKHPGAWLAPLASALGGIALLAGHTGAGAGLIALAATVFVAVNAVVVRRQRAAHTVLLLVGALAWLAGSAVAVVAPGHAAAPAWWFAFLVLTIAAERLEMARLMRARPGSRALLFAILALLLAGACGAMFAPRAGGVLYGAALVLLAGWLGVFDIARRTLHADGLARYMAVCLLGGYAWLAVAGVAWVGTALGAPWRDAALHALGLGFVVSMMMGHAPVILPAVAGIRLRFGWMFYLPLAALHLSLLVRLGGGLAAPGARATGALLNAGALALFAATVAGAALAWRRANRGAGR